jgi:RNA-directed DNA polymerase
MLFLEYPPGAYEYPQAYLHGKTFYVTKYLEALRAAKGIHGIAGLIGFAPKNLAYIIYGIPDEAKYSEFWIPKKSGGIRKINSPIQKLKHVQSRLAKHLTKCLTEIEVSEQVKMSCTLSHGFKPKHSIATNAKNHLGRRWVLNADLADFFPTINFGRVRGYFIKNKYFALDQATATLIAQIICHGNCLPQGAPTSPIVSNLIASSLDISLNRLARRHRCTYTRYADDLTFSTNTKGFSEEIAFRATSLNGGWMAGDELRYRIQRSGFALNPEKLRMQVRWSRQDVTGLVVNEKVNIPREYVKAVRAKCEYIINGKQPFNIGPKSGPAPTIEVSINQIQGMLSHIFKIKGADIEFKRPKDWQAAPAYLATHRRFLDYINFVSQAFPTILFEGETDKIYVRCALRAFEKLYPNMISDDGKKKLLVKLYRYSRTTDIVQGLAGGTGDLKD